MRLVAPEKAVLSCDIKLHDPTSEVHWYRSGKIGKMFREIFNNEKYEMRRNGDTLSLIISVSEATDSAIYRCEAINKFGKVRTESSVVVLRMYRFVAYTLYEHILVLTLSVCIL